MGLCTLCWLFISVLSLEVEYLAAKDGDLFGAFVLSIQLATIFQCSSVDSAYLLFQEKC